MNSALDSGTDDTLGGLTGPADTTDTSMFPVPPLDAPAGKGDLLCEIRDQLNPSVELISNGCENFLSHEAVAGSKELRAYLERVQIAARQLSMLINGQKRNESATEIYRGGHSVAVAAPTRPGSVLLVDDDPANLEIISMLLEQFGYSCESAQSGEEGLFLAQSKPFDLVLLDLFLPGMNGFEVLKCLRDDIELRNLPVLVLSGSDQSETAIRSIESGAEDFLPKPINPVLLKARIEACMEKKRLRDLEKEYLAQLQIEQEKSEALLLNILPKAIADRLKTGESSIVDAFPDVTVLFADLAGFTDLSTRISTEELWRMLNDIFSEFDRLAGIYGLEKIKTIGDGYMIVGGLPVPQANHAEAVAEMALDMQGVITRFNTENNTSLKIRIGINTGPVIAGIIGKKKFIYDLWGDTVNTASRMESHGHPGHIQITDTTFELLKDKFIMAKRGVIQVKGKGEMTTFLIMARKQVAEVGDAVSLA